MDESSPTLVSILIPVFNRENLISECIESAIEQTYPNIEIIISDNASTDKTWEICQTYVSKYPKIKIIKNETNVGPVRNWMRAVNEARGVYVKLLFSDDLLMPECISEMMKEIINKNVSIVFSAIKIGKDLENSVTYYHSKNRLIKKNKYLRMLQKNQAPVSPGGILIRKEDLSKNLFSEFPTAVNQDFNEYGAGPDLMISLLTIREYTHVAAISKVLIFFREHDSSISVKNNRNLVSKGYSSIWAYYLRKYENLFLWANYLSHLVIENKNYGSLNVVIMEYEGNNKKIEKFIIGFMVLIRIIQKYIYMSIKRLNTN